MKHTKEELKLYEEFIKLLTSEMYFTALMRYVETLDDKSRDELLTRQYEGLINEGRK